MGAAVQAVVGGARVPECLPAAMVACVSVGGRPMPILLPGTNVWSLLVLGWLILGYHGLAIAGLTR